MEESVTLVTAKNQHRCWKARTRVRKTRMCVDLYVLGEGAISEKGRMINSHQVYPLWKSVFMVSCSSQKAKQGISKENSADFGGFFTLCPCFDPYSIRGQCKRATTNRGIDKEKSKRKSRNTMQKDTMQKNDAKRNGVKRNRVRQTNLTHSVKI